MFMMNSIDHLQGMCIKTQDVRDHIDGIPYALEIGSMDAVWWLKISYVLSITR